MAGTGAANPVSSSAAAPTSSPSAARGAVGGRVAVAVDPAPADRHGQEGDVAPQQHRPRGHLRRALGDEAPGELPHRSDRAGADASWRTVEWMPSAPMTRS